jgi:hypothetical protein
MNYSKSLDNIDEKILKNIFSFLLPQYTWVEAINTMQVSWRFHDHISLFLSRYYKALILFNIIFIDEMKNEYSKTGLSTVSFLYPEDKYLQRRALFVKTFTLGTISSTLRSEMEMYYKVMFGTLVINPVFNSISESLKPLPGFTLNQVFLSEAHIKTLESLTSLKTLYLLGCQWTSTLYLNHLNIDKLIMYIDISDCNGDEPMIVPPLHLKDLELILCMSKPKNQLRHKKLEILLTHCHELKSL